MGTSWTLKPTSLNRLDSGAPFSTLPILPPFFSIIKRHFLTDPLRVPCRIGIRAVSRGSKTAPISRIIKRIDDSDRPHYLSGNPRLDPHEQRGNPHFDPQNRPRIRDITPSAFCLPGRPGFVPREWLALQCWSIADTVRTICEAPLTPRGGRWPEIPGRHCT